MSLEPISAVIAYLRADSDVSTLTDNVFGIELPESANVSMPAAAVVLRPAGGGTFAKSGQDFADFRIDVECYGESPYDAWLLHLAVRSAMRRLERVPTNGVLIHWAKVSSDGVAVRDPKTTWPLTFASYQVLVSTL